MGAEQLTAEQIADFRDAFSKHGKDGEGGITTKELGAVMRALGENPTEAELQEKLDEFDADCNGMIDFSEFLELMERKTREADEEKQLIEAFNVFDSDGDGFISPEDIFQVMGEEVDDGQGGDLDWEGQISRDDFVKMMMAR